ncbi:hypothetical protein RN001_014261 [Aquatica leii]|uniref:AAA+ ATPase domain-containing protein n=1 Tax=Aquatica leii TaxID=1421715 RepID=A0AAN7P415_9COLE|nr:hypothetical protein RN001_014261 [Aquatica leii]
MSKKYDKYGRRMIPELPWLPAAGPANEPQVSAYVQRAYDNAEYPPLIAHKSWTKAVPYTHTFEYYKPSETIGATYTPSAQVFKIQDMPPRKKKPPPNPLGPEGKLCYPPKRSRYEVEEEERLAEIERQKKNKIPGIVPMMDLLSGEYWVKKERALLRKQKRRELKLKIEEENRVDPFLVERDTLKKMEALLPIHPDDQKESMIKEAEIDMRRHVRPEDLQRIDYYITRGITDDMLTPFPMHMLIKAKKNMPLKEKRLLDIIECYKWEMRWNLFKYVLKDPYEWGRLKIQTFPTEYPTMLVRGPIPWHASYIMGKQLLERHLYISNPVLIKIRELWETIYSDMLILPVHRLEEVSRFPLEVSDFEAQVHKICVETRNILLNEWYPKCADLILSLKPHWYEFIPKSKDETVTSIQNYFDCVNGLMATQVRGLVLNSLHHLVNFLSTFKDGNKYTGEYYDYMILNIPLLKIHVKAVPDTANLFLEPSIDEIRNVLFNAFTEIVAVNENLPKIENIMFPEFKNRITYLFAVSINEGPIMEIIQQGVSYFEPNIYGPELYLSFYRNYFYLLNGTAKNWLLDFMTQDPPPFLKDCGKRIESYDVEKEEIIMFRNSIPLNLLSLECGYLNNTLYEIVDGLRMHIVNFYAKGNRTRNRSICDVFDGMSQRVSETTDTVVALVELQNFVAECRDVTMFNLREQIRESAENVLFLMDYAHLPVEDLQLNCRVFMWPKDMEVVIDLASQRLALKRDQAETMLRNKVAQFDQKLFRYKKQVNALKKRDPPILTMDEMAECVEIVRNLVDRLKENKQEAEQINLEEQLLDMEVSPFTLVYDMLLAVEPYDKLWNTVYNFNTQYDKWYYGPFAGLEAETIGDEVEATWRILYKLSKTLQDNPGAKRIADMTRAKVEKFKQFVPVLITVCNKGLQKRHWNQISDIVGVEIVVTPESTLHEMIEIGLTKYATQLEEISGSATKEYALEKALSKMMDEWVDIKFELSPYRETGVSILSALDEIQVMLDDHILKAQTMKGSPYVKAFEERMQKWEDKLITMQDILDAWLICQATWMYLEPIFSSEDIMRQMPTEARNFKQVDRTWRAIQANTILDTHVLKATDYKNMLGLLRESNRLLDDIQKGLNDYLEKKRLYFPRFFFLSNDELLEILSETKDPLRVQPHLKKCFEGINALDFNDDEEIVAMISAEDEHVKLSAKISPAEAKGMVEKWLLQVQVLMIQSMKDLTAGSINNYQVTDRVEWLMSWPGQVVQCVNYITWTVDVTEAINEGKLSKQVDRCTAVIEICVRLVQGRLEPGVRITVESLIVIDVHGRDIVALLRDWKVTSTADFNWISQLRYYWSDGYVAVSMITTDVAYGFEYLGNQARLVVTPLTDRCFRTLMGAFKLNLGGAPEGPAGTGKTETCKDLAKVVAKKCVVFNCSDGLDYKALGKFFKGLAQSGSWACFDEFNRIELEVLSVVAQQISSIQMAVAAKVEKFIFEGTELSLDPTCTCFITMNPGYAGRQELPDNLKVLFRTVAMMVPDYAMIGEISLYSYGFVMASSLAQKIVHTYKLCSEQLSSQNHYDYGMRAVKSVLLAAGALKKNYPGFKEPQLVLRAIIDVNLPKFLAQDVPLFEGIFSDLFPGVEVPNFERDELIDCLLKELARRNLQATPWFVEKCIQIYEMILVRHGLMVVGEPLGGKTCGYQSLAEALAALSTIKGAKLKEYRVGYRIINPKAISMGQLYGQFDPSSHEWSDGVLATTFREYATAFSSDRKWILFDGPVDAVWIENMNTVLDDNKKLCLMSGEIIQMSNKMNLIFEPADLEQASPATVSRCGMIYMEPRLLGWMAFRDSYYAKLEKTLLAEQMEIAQEVIDWLMPPCFYHISHYCKYFVFISDIHLFHSFTRLFSSLLLEEQQVSTVWLQCSLVFSVIWGLGSMLTSQGRVTFDAFFRKLLYGEDKENPKPKTFKLTKNQLFSERYNMFEYVYDKRNNGSWITWGDTVDKSQQFAPTAKLSELIIQTNESLCQKYFLKLCLTNNLPILFVGPTGTGKSAIVLDHLISLPKDKFIPNVLNFSARTSSGMTQEIVMSKLDKRRKGVFGPAMGKKCVLFVDDVGMPQKEQWGAQPPVELLRQLLDHGYWFERDTSSLYLVDILFVGAMGPPGGGANMVTSRFLRHMQIICLDSFGDDTLNKIFLAILEWHFAKGFDDNICRQAKNVVNATMEIYKAAMEKFLPTPTKSHYTFSLRDFSRVIGGLLLVPASRMEDVDKLIRLWIHESFRVFNDRLIDEADKLIFFDIVNKTCYAQYRQHMEKVMAKWIPEGEKLSIETTRNLFFGNYMDPDADPKIYNEVDDLEDLVTKMNYYLGEFNLVSRSPMHLVMFKFAIEHVSRVSRVLMQDNGNVLLVGIGGSGRHSAVKLATAMAEYNLFEIEISRNYGVTEWRDDLKRLLLKAGCEGKPIVFLFADTQIKSEAFTEDVNMILNTADVPNLYAPDEKAEILEKMQNAARDSGRKIDSTPLALYNFFIERIRNNLHVALAMSPIGGAFRVRCRMFPSLINCCTIDWFLKWPDDALEKVANMFLKQTDITDEMIEKCVFICKHFHTKVEDASDRFYEDLKRRTYVTPTSYLELIQTFKSLYYLKVDQITMQRNRYETGLEKLDFAAGQVSLMQEELHALQPKLVVASAKTEKLMVKIEQDTVEVEKKKEVVGADEALANEAAAASQAIKDDCESDLAEAIPALQAAVEALDTLKPADVTLVKSMKNPPYGVKLVMEAVCVMKGSKPDRKPDPGSGKMVEDYWGPSVKLLADMKFLDSLKTYDKDNINPAIMKRIRDRYIPDRDFDPANIRNVSTACEGLCKWVRALEVYDRVIKIVAPKKERLNAAEAELAVQMETLNLKRAQLKEVTDKLQALNDEFAAETKKKKDLEDLIELCSQKLIRAEQLIGGLGGEKTRWSEAAEYLAGLLGNVIGDVLLSAGVVAYLGAFTVDYRNAVISEWNSHAKIIGVPCADKFSLVSTLGEPVIIRAWNIAGLPVDNFSIENGIIATKARRWPLMIDPQGQANKWIKNMEKHNKLQMIKLTDSNYVRVMENAITFGSPVILENIQQDIDAVLDPVLTKNIFKQSGVYYIKLGDNVLEYSFDFRFYITTQLRNPHYLPELAVKVTLLNFMITPQGLQDQLLGIVVARERPELEEKKNLMIIEGAHNKKLLKEIEDKILEVLSSSEGNILEDETAIKILSSSKVVSEEIQAKQEIAAITEKEIDEARNGYTPVSKHSSVLFFCITELANIDPMYQYSLAWFINLYNQSITNSKKSSDLEERMENLNDYFTSSIYRNVCRSLFEKDKLIFSLVLTVGISRSQNLIDEDTWNFLLTGGVALDNPFPNPGPEWLSDKSWSEIVRASNLKNLGEFKKAVEKNIKAWKEFYDSSNPHECPCPAPMDKLNGLARLVALRCIRPDKVVPGVATFIVENMGQAYLEPPQFNIEESYRDSNNCTPLIFILSAGSDPMSGLIRFASDRGISKQNVMSVSLGQGQGPIASGMINKALVTGQWVVLQNCHLAESWMRELNRICDEVIVPEHTNSHFRLWLTSYPSRAFPVAILQNGTISPRVKMTNEAPKGLRQNLLKSYSSDPISDADFYNSCPKWREFQNMLFGLCFFHALIQERRKFGPLGWNIPYEFNESDLRICILQLQMFLTEYDEVPFEALTYLTGECNYGGRVTDDKDRRLLNSLLSIFYCQEIITTPGYNFSPSGIYYVPTDTSHEGCLNYIRSLPLIQLPEVYGLHENADITKDNQETLALLNGILLTQTQITAGGGGGDSDAMIVDLANDIIGKVPNPFNIEAVSEKYPVMYMNSMNTVLRQELIRFNRLIVVVHRTLRDIIKAVKGLVVMNKELEETHSAVVIGKVPNAWMSKSYPSLKPLGSYTADLIARIKFLQNWIDVGPPLVFWLSGFYFTQSFLTGVLQNYSRREKFPIDWIHFEYYTTEYETTATQEPPTGVYIRGLFLEGARWDRKLKQLNESYPKILFDVIPIMWLKPGIKSEYVKRPSYTCPLYKTSARRGVLSTTGHSTNFVMFLTIDTNLSETHWINRGVAGLCQLSD